MDFECVVSWEPSHPRTCVAVYSLLVRWLLHTCWQDNKNGLVERILINLIELVSAKSVQDERMQEKF